MDGGQSPGQVISGGGEGGRGTAMHASTRISFIRKVSAQGPGDKQGRGGSRVPRVFTWKASKMVVAS